MAELLVKDKTIIVDDEMVPFLSLYPWRRQKNSSGTEYAITYANYSGKQLGLLMHRLLLGMRDNNRPVQHLNGNTLDNRLCNLRFIARFQSYNYKEVKAISGYRGVYQQTRSKKYGYQFVINKNTHTNYGYSSAKAAYEAYLKKRDEVWRSENEVLIKEREVDLSELQLPGGLQ